jgi:hypothetical protein
MIKKLTPYSIVLFIIACSAPKVYIPGTYENRAVFNGHEEAAASQFSIKNAGKLAEEHPKESMIYDEIKMTLNFDLNEKYDSTEYYRINDTLAKNDSDELDEEATKENAEQLLKALNKTNKKGKYTINIDFNSIANKVKSERPIPDGEVFASTKFEYNFITIKDYVEEQFVVGYNSMSSVKGFKFKIDENAAEIYSRTANSDGQEYFKTDSRYKIYDLDLPIRGTSVNVKYNEDCRDAKFNSIIYIPEEHFTQKKIIKIATPDWMEYDIIEKNFEGLDFKKEVVEEAIKADDDDDESTTTTKSGKKVLKRKKKDAKKMKYTIYTFRNIKAFENVSGGRGSSYNYPHLYFHYKTVTDAKGKKNMLNNLGDLYNWYKLVTGNLKNDTSAFAGFTKDLVKNAKTDEEKIKTVYYWIQDNIRYIAFEDGIAGFRPDECKNVYTNRYGDCKGMANLCRNMLKVLGYDAHMVWIGTRHLNYSYDVPGLPVDNHAICAVKLNGKNYFLDATESYCSLGDYANRIQGRKCIVENGPTYLLETIPEFGPEHNEDNTIETIELQDEVLNTRTKKTFKGESKITFIRSFNYLKSQNKDEILYNYLTNNKLYLEAKNITSSDLTNRDKDPELNYELNIQNHAFKANGKTYVNLDWDREFSGYDFDSTRTVDYDFDSKICVKRTATLVLKAGQKAAKLPENINIDNEYYSFQLEMKQVGNTVIYKKSLVFKKDYLPVNKLQQFNKDSKKLSTYYNTYIEII